MCTRANVSVIHVSALENSAYALFLAIGWIEHVQKEHFEGESHVDTPAMMRASQ